MSSNINDTRFLGLTFSQLDTNGNGVIEREELEQAESISLFLNSNTVTNTVTNNTVTNTVTNNTVTNTVATDGGTIIGGDVNINITVGQLEATKEATEADETTNDIDPSYTKYLKDFQEGTTTINNKNTDTDAVAQGTRNAIETIISAFMSLLSVFFGGSSNKTDNAAEATAPANTAPETEATAPANTAPANTAPANTAPANTAPATAPANTAPAAEATTSNNNDVQQKSDIRPGFDANAVASSLYRAMKGGGTTESVVEKWLGDGNLTDAELRLVLAAFEQITGETLQEWIEDDFSGNDEDKYVGRIKAAEANIQKNADGTYNISPSALAEEFFNAVKGGGTDEVAVYKILNLEPELFKQVVEAYNFYYADSYDEGSDFEYAIKDEFSGSAEDTCMAMYKKRMNAD